jgi:four helix bundle protein
MHNFRELKIWQKSRILVNARFLDIAISSGFEIETDVILAYDLDYITENDLNESITKIQEVQKMIFAFRNSLK